MDLVITSPNPNAAMGSDSIEVDSTATVNDNETIGAVVPFCPSPSGIETEDLSYSTGASSEESVPVQNDTIPESTPLSSSLIEPVALESVGDHPAQLPPLVAAEGLQIVTRRKRSCVTAAAAAAAAGSVPMAESGGTIPSTNSQHQTPDPTSVVPATTSQPPKKKKKYIPKAKKPAGEVKPKAEPKPRPAPRPKAPKKPAEKKSQSKSKKCQQGQLQQQSTTTEVNSLPESCSTPNGTEVLPENTEEDVQQMSQLPEPVPLVLKPMPKLKKMPTMVSSPAMFNSFPSPIPLSVHIKEEPQEWDENTECDIPPIGGDFIEEPQSEPVPVGVGVGEKPVSSSRKKKSKGRNGNIYIGVFNRIEWMKLQGEFGFQTVNNFGTFVLQTMRRVHGDIQFWCDVAKASGVYPELSHYEWINGFPHATNKDGQHFSPDPETIQMSLEKSSELGEMARKMWEVRLELLKQQQQEQQQEVPAEVVTVPDDVEEVEEEDGEDPGLENYLENMATGQYLPSSLRHEGNQSTSSVSRQVTAEQVNRIWSEQAQNPQSLEIFGKLINFVNGIQCNQQAVELTPQIEENEMEEVVQEEEEDDNMEEFDGTDPVQLASAIIEEVLEEEEESMQIDETAGAGEQENI